VIRSKKHLGFVASLPCVLCGEKSIAAHIRIGGGGGMGLKPHDSHTVPLCHLHHSKQHNEGERTFWGDVQKAINLANHIYANTGDDDYCRLKITEFRREFYNKK
jgi:hypothetical protein